VILPGPTLPAVAQLALYAADPLGSLERWSRRYGETFACRFAGVGPIVFTSSPAHIRAIFAADPDVLEAGPENAGLRPVVGKKSVLVLDGREHQRHRRLILPLFHAERMRAHAELMRAAAVAEVDSWPVGRRFTLQPRLDALTLRVIVRALCADDALAEPFARVIHAYASPVVPLLAYAGLEWHPAVRRVTELDRAIYAEIARRRRAGAPGGDGLGLLMSARDPDGNALDDRELRDELVSLVLAGHDTVAGAAAWAIELLLDHPVALARAAHDPAYLDAAIRESLRLRPVLAVVARRARVPFELAGHALPAGTWLAPSIHLTHHRADLYPEPHAFRPERFLGRKPDPYHWLPFGGGGRRCLGMGFALAELKVILGTILERVQPTTLRTRPAAIARRNITLVPAGDVPVRCALP